MDFIESVNTYVTGTFPDAVADNSSGVATADGFEFIAEWINNSVIGNQQDWMNYAGLTPNGVTESDGFSQVREAVQLGHGIGPGKAVIWLLDDDPSVTGDRVLLLEGQGVLIASYPLLDAVSWVGDAGGTHNAAVKTGGGFFYRSSDAAGTTPNAVGPYLQLPESRGYAMRVLDTAATIDPDGASRFLGDVQVDAMQRITGEHAANVNAGPIRSGGGDQVGVFTDGTVRAQVVEITVAAGFNLLFDSSLSVSPNVAKTDDIETRMSNFSIKLGITY